MMIGQTSGVHRNSVMEWDNWLNWWSLSHQTVLSVIDIGLAWRTSMSSYHHLCPRPRSQDRRNHSSTIPIQALTILQIIVKWHTTRIVHRLPLFILWKNNAAKRIRNITQTSNLLLLRIDTPCDEFLPKPSFVCRAYRKRCDKRAIRHDSLLNTEARHGHNHLRVLGKFARPHPSFQITFLFLRQLQ